MGITHDVRVDTLMVTLIAALLSFITAGIFKLVSVMGKFVSRNNTEHGELNKNLAKLNEKVDFIVDKEMGHFKKTIDGIKDDMRQIDKEIDDHEKRIYGIEKMM